MIHWIVSRAIDHRSRFVVICIVLLAVTIGLSLRLSTRLDMDDFLPSTAESIPENSAGNSFQEDIVSTFGGSGRIVVYVESRAEIPIQEAARIINELSAQLVEIDGVRSLRGHFDPKIIKYLEEHGPERLFLYLDPYALKLVGERLTKEYINSALRLPPDRDDSPLDLFDRVGKKDPLGLRMLAAQIVYHIAGSSPIRIEDGYFSLPDRRIFFLVIEPDPGTANLDYARNLVRDIDNVLVEYRENPQNAKLLNEKRISAIGRPISYVAASDTVRADVRVVGFTATVLIVILLALFFRSFLVPLIIVLPVVFGLTVTGAVAYLLFGTVSLIAWVFVGVLIGLGVDFSLHIVSHYLLHSVPGSSRADTLRSAIQRPGRGIVIAGLTTTAAFLSLSVLSYPVMKQVAVLTATGLLAMLAGSFTVTVLGLSFLDPNSNPERNRAPWSFFGKVFGGLNNRHPISGLLFWALIALIAGYSATFIRFEPHPWKLALRGNPKSAEMNRLNKELGSSFSPILVVSSGLTIDEAIAKDRSAVDILKRGAQRAQIVSIESLSNWLPERTLQESNIRYVRDHAELFSRVRFLRDYDSVVKELQRTGPRVVSEYLEHEYPNLIAGFLDSESAAITLGDLRTLGLDSEIDKFVSRDRVAGSNQFAVVSYVYLRQFPWAEGSVSRFLETYEMLGGDKLQGVALVGTALRSARHTGVLRRDVLLASVLALALVFGILFLSFRNLLDVFLSLLPAVCGVAASLIVMAVLKIELNLLTLGITPLIIGIGVDDGIHIVERMRQSQNMDLIIRETGSSMAMTTLTTVAAFVCLGLAKYEGIRELGIVGAIGLVACLFASLHLVPILFLFRSRD